MFEYKHVIIGAGVVGLAITKRLSNSILLEKLPKFGMEISSRNSEVIHSGLYYPAGDLKTRLCIKGRKMLYEYLEERGIAYKKVGKYIVGNDKQRLLDLYQKTKELGIPCHQLESSQLEYPLTVKHGIELTETGIFDSHHYMACLEQDILDSNTPIVYNTTILDITKQQNGYLVKCKQLDDEFEIFALNVVNCAGLNAHEIYNLYLKEERVKLYYCKGHYYKAPRMFDRLIYPLPDKHSLGLHLTVGLDGSNRFGPDVYFQPNLDYSFNGDPRKAREIVNQYMDCPELEPDYTGIRPKLSASGYSDFYISQDDKGFINLLGIESPGLTSSLAIADYVHDLIYPK